MRKRGTPPPRSLAALAGARIEAICDLDPDRVAAAASLAPEAHVFHDPETLFEAGSYDFVEICTRPDAHRELVELAARHAPTCSARSPRRTSAPTSAP